MKFIIYKIDIINAAKISAGLYACFGIAGSFIFLGISLLDGRWSEDGLTAAASAIALILVFPILYAIIGWLSGAAVTYLLNRFLGFFGGLPMEAEECHSPKPNETGGVYVKSQPKR